MGHPIRRALISVSDKTGIVEFAAGLAALNIEIFSTGGTARELAGAGIPVIEIEALTGFPEMMDGRLKTLHPAVHGGLLADRARREHMAAIETHGIRPIDLLIVNLYPFEETVARSGCTREEAIEKIDIGGPAMIRSAAKNHSAVAVVTDPADYAVVLDELQVDEGLLSEATRRTLARRAFALTAAYDTAIAAYLAELDETEWRLPDRLQISAPPAAALRYGENPHQPAALYREARGDEPCAARAIQLHGKEPSFINYLDMDAALELVKEFNLPACAIIKHTNPCGCATGASLLQAYERARDGELPPRNSRFGGVIAFNREVDGPTAASLIAPGGFYECIVAPAFSPEALDAIRSRSGWGGTVRLFESGELPSLEDLDAAARGLASLDVRRIVGGFLVQKRDRRVQQREGLQFPTKRRPSEAEVEDMLFAWRVVRHVKSNAIVLARDGQLIGSGPGQTSRVQSSAIALEIAGERAAGAVCASDAFFPFADGPEALARAGVAAIIQPGGSNRDAEVIEACDRCNIAMAFTGARHFRH